MKNALPCLALLLGLAAAVPVAAGAPAKADRAAAACERVRPALGEHFGKPVFLCIIKEKLELELWVQEKSTWRVLKTYPVAGMSGTLGPKTAEGDCQAPEGFYAVLPGALNPKSNYHLSFDIGYPNAYDRELGRTGCQIMVHGSDCSIGCFAMTDPGIEEIYTMVDKALQAGQKAVPVQIYPFEMTPERMQREKDSPHIEFWRHIRRGWQFTHTHAAPYLP